MLAMLLRSPVAFIGVMGSRRHVAHYVEDLRSRGFADEDLARIRSPLGLDLGGRRRGDRALDRRRPRRGSARSRGRLARPVTNASGRTAGGPGEGGRTGPRMAGAVLAAIAVAVAAARPVPDVGPTRDRT